MLSDGEMLLLLGVQIDVKLSKVAAVVTVVAEVIVELLMCCGVLLMFCVGSGLVELQFKFVVGVVIDVESLCWFN